MKRETIRNRSVQRRKRALVTGATGYLGGWLARRLVTEGWHVEVIAREHSSLERLADLNVVVHVDDGRAPMHNIVKDAAPEVCFHMAGYFTGAHNDEDIEPLVVNNILFGTRLVDALSLQRQCHLVSAGSYWQHQGDSSYHPGALYAATKQAFQDIVEFYRVSDGLRTTTLKLFETYGPSDPRPKIVNLLLDAAATGRWLAMSEGQQLLDLVYVDDVATGFIAASQNLDLNDPPSRREFALSSGAPIRLRDLVIAIEGIIGCDVPIEWGKKGYRRTEMFEPWVIAPVVPNWSPAVSLDRGIRAAWDSRDRSRAVDK